MKKIYGLGLLLIPVVLFSQGDTEKNNDPSKKNAETVIQDNISLSGHITDEKTKLPLAGATIHIKGTTHEVQTGAKGEFKFVTGQKIPVVFIITYIGYETLETTIDRYNNIVISLHEASTQLNDVVVVGYGTQKRAALISAVSTVNGNDIKNIPVAGFDAQLQGKAAGVQVNSQSGVPGEGVRIRVRGSTSINASNDPLYILDGVFINSNTLSSQNPTGNGIAGPVNLGEKTTSPLADISPADIESLEVLKDAEATAIYGSRGANGVVIITTKRGAFNGKSKINFNSSVGVAAVQRSRLWKAVSGPDHAIIANETWINSGADDTTLHQTAANEPFQRSPDGTFNPGAATFRGNPSDQGSYTETRLNQVFRNALLQNYDLSFQGGTASSRYYIGTSYASQQAVIKPADFTRAGLKANFDSRLSDKVQIGISNLFSRSYRTQLRDGNGPDAGIFQSALQTPSYLPTNDAAGNPLR